MNSKEIILEFLKDINPKIKHINAMVAVFLSSNLWYYEIGWSRDSIVIMFNTVNHCFFISGKGNFYFSMVGSIEEPDIKEKLSIKLSEAYGQSSIGTY